MPFQVQPVQTGYYQEFFVLEWRGLWLASRGPERQ
jgi:hypothetical protein